MSGIDKERGGFKDGKMPSRLGAGYPVPKKPLRYSYDRFFRLLVTTLVVAVALWLLWYFFALFVYLVIGIFLAYILKPLVDRMQGFGIGRIPAIIGTFVLVFGTISLLLTYLVPFVTDQVGGLSRQISFQRVAQITAVEPGAVSDSARLEVGQFITAVDGESWHGYSQLNSILRSKQPGETLTLTVENDAGISRTIVVEVENVGSGVELVQRSASADDLEERNVEALGITIREVALSDVATFIENQLRRVIPVEQGAVIGGITAAFEEVFRGDRITATVGSVVDLFTNLFYAIIVIPFTTFFFLKDGGVIRRSALRAVPNRYFEVTLAIVEKIETNIGRYFRALFLQAVAVATVASILLKFTGLNYALAVGIFTGVANVIPYFGPLMGFIAGVLVGVAQTGDFSLFLGVTTAMILTQLSDNLFFQPFIFSRAARAHPLIILFVVLVGAHLAGIIGMLVAIPVTAAIRVTIEQIVWSVRNYRILRA